MNKKTTSLKANVVMNMVYEVFIIILPFITGPYISRVLQADGVGTESYLSSLLSYFTMFAALGTVSYGTYCIARNREDKKELSKTFWEIEILSIVTSGIMIVAWMIFATSYKEYTTLMYIQTLNLVGTALSINWLFAGLEKFQYNIVISTIIRALSVVCIFVFVKSPNDLWAHILISALSTFLGSLSLWVFVPKFISFCKINWENIFKVRLKETLVYFIPTIATSIYTVLDKSLIGIITNDSFQNGYYEQATKIINMAKTVSFVAIHGVMVSRASFYFKNEDEEKARELAIQDYKIISFLSVGIAFGIAVIAKTFVPIFFGDGYEPTIYIMYILCAVVPIIGVSNALGSIYYTPSGRRLQSSWYLIAGSVTNLILNICLIPSMGAYGAAIATVIAESVITILYIYYARKFLPARLIAKLYWKKIIAGIIMLISCFAYEFTMSGRINTYLILGSEIILGAIIYIIVLAIFKDCSIEFGIEFIKGKLKRRQ